VGPAPLPPEADEEIVRVLPEVVMVILVPADSPTGPLNPFIVFT
jgi:hypothetical protein